MESFVTKMKMVVVAFFLIIMFFSWVQWDSGGRYNQTIVDPQAGTDCGNITHCPGREPKMKEEREESGN